MIAADWSRIQLGRTAIHCDELIGLYWYSGVVSFTHPVIISFTNSRENMKKEKGYRLCLKCALKEGGKNHLCLLTYVWIEAYIDLHFFKFKELLSALTSQKSLPPSLTIFFVIIPVNKKYK